MYVEVHNVFQLIYNTGGLLCYSDISQSHVFSCWQLHMRNLLSAVETHVFAILHLRSRQMCGSYVSNWIFQLTSAAWTDAFVVGVFVWWLVAPAAVVKQHWTRLLVLLVIRCRGTFQRYWWYEVTTRWWIVPRWLLNDGEGEMEGRRDVNREGRTEKRKEIGRKLVRMERGCWYL